MWYNVKIAVRIHFNHGGVKIGKDCNEVAPAFQNKARLFRTQDEVIVLNLNDFAIGAIVKYRRCDVHIPLYKSAFIDVYVVEDDIIGRNVNEVAAANLFVRKKGRQARRASKCNFLGLRRTMGNKMLLPLC